MLAMFRKHFQPKTLMKNTLAAFLLIAVSGAYCLLCCQEISAAFAKAEHCPLTKTVKSEHCNFSTKSAAETSETAAAVNFFECCGLKFNFIVAKLEKNEFPHQTPASANSFSDFLPVLKLENKSNFTNVFYRATVFEKRDLHIKNCVFRI